MTYRNSLTFCLGFLASLASAAPLDSEDIIKMSQAGLDESIIITAISHSETEFDTSASGLIALSAAKVSEGVINAMLKKGSGPAIAAETGAATSPAAEAASNTMSPSDVTLIDGETTRTMRYLVPQMRTKARGLGFGGIASYAVLRGSAASDRTNNKKPAFRILVPDQAQVESYLTVASFAVRKNNSREVMIGGGYMSYSTGIHPDRVIAVTSTALADQSTAPDGFTLYEVSPANALEPGEYAVILYTGEMQGLVGAYFTGSGNSFFDFGVDA